ncbi:MAG: Rieske (2Fe-2S) protein [Chitinophagaceae bacterium]|nr:Rieske (2Fe-2S) protein [Chitinophagaceae bacterium]
MERRIFIKQGCAACMGLVGASMLLEGCSSGLPLVKASQQNEVLTIPLNKFSGNSNLLIVRSSSLESDILLVKNQEGYKALNLKCTHEGVGLTATDKKIFCSAHGSSFDFDGNVLKEPALKPLKQFRTEVSNGNIIIHLI